MDNTKRFFAHHQRMLLSLVNTQAGRVLLGITDPAPIVKLTPNAIHQVIGVEKDHLRIVARIFPDSNAVARILCPIYLKMHIAHTEYQPLANPLAAFEHYAGLTPSSRYPQIFLTASNFTPGAGSGSVQNPSIGTWAGARNAVSGNLVSNPATADSPIGTTTGGTYYIYRAFMPTDTSSLGSGANITNVVWNGYVTAVSATPNQSYDLIQTSQANPAALATTDFGNVAFTSGGSVTITGTGAYTITGNATARTWISKTGYSKLGLLDHNDLANTTPTTLQDNTQNFPAAGSNKPFITVTYTTGGIMDLEI